MVVKPNLFGASHSGGSDFFSGGEDIREETERYQRGDREISERRQGDIREEIGRYQRGDREISERR